MLTPTKKSIVKKLISCLSIKTSCLFEFVFHRLFTPVWKRSKNSLFGLFVKPVYNLVGKKISSNNENNDEPKEKPKHL